MATKKAGDDRAKKSETPPPKKGKANSSPTRATADGTKTAASTSPPKTQKVSPKMAAAPRTPKVLASDARNLAAVSASIVPTTGFDKFFLDVLNELAEASFARAGDDWPAMGIYYRPAPNSANVFILWVTVEPSDGRITPPFTTPDFIKSESFSVTLNPNQLYLQYVVDVATISLLLSEAGPVNHPDVALINGIFGAIRTGDFHVFHPTGAANPKTAIAQSLLALILGWRRAANATQPTMDPTGFPIGW